MSIQVSPTLPDVESEIRSELGLSGSAQKRQACLSRLLELAIASPSPASWLQSLRDRATAQVQSQSFPSNRDEAWRFTDLSNLLGIEFAAAANSSVQLADLAAYVLPEAEHSRLVFVDGVYAPHLSDISNLPATLQVGNLAALAEPDELLPYLAQQSGADELFTALNTAGLSDAAVIVLPKQLVVDPPIHLLFVATGGDPRSAQADQRPTLTQPRCLVVAGVNSALTFVEDYVTLGSGVCLTNAVTEIWLAENAQVNHTRVQRDSLAAFHIGKTAVSQARSSRYTGNALSLGAALSRHHLEIYQTGEQTETTLNGLTMIAGTQVGDLHSAIALTQPYGTTRQLQKCIVGDRAHAIFNGKVLVPRAAQLTDAGQLNRTLLLSPKARVDTKPQLEIVADNVKCTHGATVGQLEADEVFYLQSRGIDAASARRLLVYAFAYEIIDQIAIASLKQTLCQFITSHAD